MKTIRYLTLLTVFTLPAFGQTVEEVTEEFWLTGSQACQKVDATLRREGAAIAAKLIEKGDTAGAALVGEQIDTKIKSGSIPAPHEAAAALFSLYDNARQAALKPIQAASLQRLDTMLKTPAAKDINFVLKIGKARETIEGGRLNPLMTTQSPSLLAAPGAEGQIVEIDATSEAGFSLGKLTAGQQIRLSYVDGTWSAYITWPPDSPDESPNALHRVALVGVTAEGPQTIAVPPNTKKRTFVHKVTQDGDYALRIADGQIQSNSGKVRYRVSVTASRK